MAGKYWYIDSDGKRKRTPEGNRHESQRELFAVFFSFFERLEIFDMAFPSAPFFEPNGNFPRLAAVGVIFFHITYPPHSTETITATKVFGIATVLFGGDKTKIAPTVVKSISIDVINESPTVLGFSYNTIMDKIRLIPSISIVALVEPFSLVIVFPNIFIDFCIPDKFVFIIMKWGFDVVVMYDRFLKNSLSRDRRQDDFTPTPPATVLPCILPSFYDIFIWHTGIIPRVKKFHNRRLIYG